ncbi:hypothetical protein [Pseudocitrobacter corydidari]|uniref:Lipoprotein n=1 Tax=Pseudocitrobacter corydidari TaxID=2891570 RepID=A0ABY3RZC7_9ENTR|nr:hypothetical protein [Pseudocitrobacter corydidari]UGS39699.1 hypothetical protein G163CM_03830 [Pseudocitrobacter corydidari]
MFVKYKALLLFAIVTLSGCADNIDADGVNPAALKAPQPETCPVYDHFFTNKGEQIDKTLIKGVPEYLSSLFKDYLRRYDARYGDESFITYPQSLTPEVRLSINGTEGYLFLHLKEGGWRQERLLPVHCENGRMVLKSKYRENVYSAYGTLVLRPEGDNLRVTIYMKAVRRVAGIFSVTESDMLSQWRFHQADPVLRASALK